MSGVGDVPQPAAGPFAKVVVWLCGGPGAAGLVLRLRSFRCRSGEIRQRNERFETADECEYTVVSHVPDPVDELILEYGGAVAGSLRITDVPHDCPVVACHGERRGV